MSVLLGWQAAKAGAALPIDASAEFIEGWRGFHDGARQLATIAADNFATYNSASAKAARAVTKSKLRRRCYSATPRAL